MQKYDYIFCGSGASASLILLQLHQQNLLQNLNILLIDPDKKEKRDKTFCFWSDEKELISSDLHLLISHKWNQVALSDEKVQSITPLQYNHISSTDLYNQIHQLAIHYQWQKKIAYVDVIKADKDGPFVIINGDILRAQYIFDSRPPAYKPPQLGETHISQSFVGWMIETEDDIKNYTAFRFMDFEVEQQDSTQFVYVLPFSNKTALVEVTRFGANIIDKDAAETLLDNYIRKHFGNYSIQDIEIGCIPMSNTEINNSLLPGVIVIGARNYQIKPSTGYAFKSMYYEARLIAEAINQKQPIVGLNKSKLDAYKGRFSFYDGLLLDILKNNPKEGKPIFDTLLKKVEVKKVLNFLDEKTTIIADISIFRHLPWRVFINTLIKRTFQIPWLRPLILSFITSLLLFLGNNTPLQNYLAYSMIILGLVSVGIPHGAVDHLLETGTWNKKVTPLFILKYIFLAICMGLLWYTNSSIGLILFLIYSSWHFGQADGKQWQLSKWISTLWGAFVLFYILGTHVDQTNQILIIIANLVLPIECPVWLLLPWLLVAVFQKNISFALTIFWISLSAYLPLIISFALYFIGQHSLTGWYDIRKHLNISNRLMWLHSFPFHFAAWLFLLVFLYYSSSAQSFQEQRLWSVFFIFIACISFPHVIFMNTVYTSKKKNNSIY